MPRKYKRVDGQPLTRYPNATKEWFGCPMACPESCPYEECIMPPEIAARTQDPVWHGWIIDKDGFTVMEGKQYGRVRGRKCEA